MKLRKGRQVRPVRKAAENANGLITEIRQFGLDFSIPSTNPLTFRVEVADREIPDNEKQGVLDLLMSLFGRGK